DCVQPRHDVVKHQEQLHVLHLLRTKPLLLPFIVVEGEIRDQLFVVIPGILKRLDNQERGSQKGGGHQQPDQRLPAAGGRGVNRQRHRQAAGEQHYRVDRREGELEFLAGRLKLQRVQRAIYRVAEEQRSEDHQLGG